MKTTIRSDAGFTLLEALVSLLIFSIGALGVLGLVTTSLRTNAQARQISEASLVGQWKVEQLQVRPITDAYLASGCAAAATLTTMCRQNGGSSTPITTAASMTIGDVGAAAVSSARYQVFWNVRAVPSQPGMSAIDVQVMWPRDRNLQGLDAGATGFVDCGSTPERCFRVAFNSYRL